MVSELDSGELRNFAEQTQLVAALGVPPPRLVSERRGDATARSWCGAVTARSTEARVAAAAGAFALVNW